MEQENFTNEMIGNLQLEKMLILIRKFLELGIHISIENPLSSFIWKVEELEKLKSEFHLLEVVFDQCMFGLKPPDHASSPGDNRVKKPTKLLTSVPFLRQLATRCDRLHDHVGVQGRYRSEEGKWCSRASAAGVYPVALCKRWSALVARQLRHAEKEFA